VALRAHIGRLTDTDYADFHGFHPLRTDGLGLLAQGRPLAAVLFPTDAEKHSVLAFLAAALDLCFSASVGNRTANAKRWTLRVRLDNS
jgi:hypothetical protein